MMRAKQQKEFTEKIGTYDRAKLFIQVVMTGTYWNFKQQRCALDFKTLDLNQQYLTTEPMYREDFSGHVGCAGRTKGKSFADP
jgi:hypothetical protein